MSNVFVEFQKNMALQCNTISEITKNKMKWNLKVGVVHFRTTPNKYKPDIPMVLILQNEKVRFKSDFKFNFILKFYYILMIMINGFTKFYLPIG